MRCSINGGILKPAQQLWVRGRRVDRKVWLLAWES